MKTFYRALSLFLFFLVASAIPLHAQTKPNVIVIYTDDQGTLDANCYGSKDLATPNIDRLAKTGIRFTQMYAPSCICSASRAGMITGRYPIRAGVPANVSSKPGNVGMPPSEVTMAEMFRAAGYETAHVGKWHLGYTPETMPNAQGFDSSFGHMGGCIDNYSHYFYWSGPNRHDLWRDGVEIWRDGQFFPDLMAKEMKRLLDRPHKKPFYIYWAINVPHYPYQGTEKWREHYRDLEAPRRMYAAFVSSMDEKVGEVLDFLEQKKLRENTIVLLQSDHGHSTEERAFFGGGNAGPYRGAKACFFEGGIRVPSVISWPAKLPQGEVRDQMVTGCDWYPTLASLAEIDLPNIKLDGKNITEILVNPNAESPHSHFYWQMGANREKAQWVVRKGNWKLLGNCRDTSNKGILTKQDRKLFLANLKEDPSESKNLAQDHPEIVKQLLEIREQNLISVYSEKKETE